MPEQRNYEGQLTFPFNGVDQTRALMGQRTGTTPSARNVRGFDPGSDRSRGGRRPGMERFSSTLVDANGAEIQMIDHLVTTSNVMPLSTIGQFVYGNDSAGTDQGFGIGSPTAGASIVSYTSDASYAFACSCWDDDGNVYIAAVKTSDGTSKIYKYTSAGTSVWTQTGLAALATGSLRKFAGMVIIGNYLYVATVHSGAPTNRIQRINKTSGVIANTQFYSNATGSVGATFVFSTGAVNCIGKIGNLLGVECVATGTSQGFRILDTSKSGIQGTIYTLWGGTAANNRAVVASDGTTFFYVLASTTASKVRKIGTGGVQAWSTTAADTNIRGLCYDQSNGFLWTVGTTTPAVKRLSTADGSLANSYDPDSSTTWDWITSSNNGLYILYEDATASNDVMQANTTMTKIWRVTLANTGHSGASANKGQFQSTSQSNPRQTRLFAIAGGTLKRVVKNAVTGYWAPTSIVSGGSSFASNKVVWGAQNGNDFYFVDGSSYLVYTASTDAITAVTATAGSLPLDSQNRPGNLMCNWRGRNVFAGLPDQGHLIFMSAQFAPTDFSYNPTVITATTAWAGEDSLGGNVGDLVTCLLPYSDDTLLIGCDHTIWQMTGDPQLNGQLDRITGILGMAWGRPFAIDPNAQVYFMGSDCEIYKMTPGGLPIPMSQQIRRRLQKIHLADYLVRMEWDLFNNGLAVWVTPFDASKETENFFWEARTSAWWPDKYGDPRLNPLAVHSFDGDDPNDRIILLGGRDSYLRLLSEDAKDDDRFDIDSFVWLGPIMTPQLDEIMNRDVQATLSIDSGDVQFEIYTGDTAEQALLSEPRIIGIWEAARNYVSAIQESGIVTYLRIVSSNKWALEKIRYRYMSLGPIRRGL